MDIIVETSDGKGDSLLQWNRPAHLDDDGHPDPRVANVAREYDIDVNEVLQREVGIASGSNSVDTRDTSANDGGNDGSSDGGNGGYNENYFPSQMPLSPFTSETDSHMQHKMKTMDLEQEVQE
ncbi:hypothetical protein ACS0TY_021420 [Phlomoides rotata]